MFINIFFLQSKGGLHLLGMFMAQTELINNLSSTSSMISAMNKPRDERIKELRKMLSSGGNLSHLGEFPALRLPIDPRFEITGAYHLFFENSIPVSKTDPKQA